MTPTIRWAFVSDPQDVSVPLKKNTRVPAKKKAPSATSRMAKAKAKAKAKASTTLPAKKASTSTSKMSKAPAMTHAEVSILGKMASLEDDSPRYRVLESALAFKSSWVILGEHLSEILKNQFYKGWGYASFERYCADELFITAATAKKLVRSFSWIGDEAPEYLPPRSRSELVKRKEEATLPDGPLPDFNAVNVLADAKKALGEAKVSEDAYLSLKRAALEGENAASLKRSLNEAIPEDLKPKKADDKVRHLRRALSSCVKTLDELREWDSGGESAGDDLLVMAENLRDAIALRLPKEA
jgi:hypothetical protein